MVIDFAEDGARVYKTGRVRNARRWKKGEVVMGRYVIYPPKTPSATAQFRSTTTEWVGAEG